MNRVCVKNSYQDTASQWYNPALAGALTFSRFLFNRKIYEHVIELLRTLTPDDYAQFLNSYISSGIKAYGSHWRYADICTVLLMLSSKLHIENYLEIGVRRGRSMAMVASQQPQAVMVGFDLWQPGYAGMENPGPEFVVQELTRIGFKGELELVSGDSHVTVPEYFSAHPEAFFDLVTVDGDHTKAGARVDLETVIPRIRVGGALVFDDITHPKHRYLMDVWHDTVASREDFSTYEYRELGYGVAFAVRMS